MTDIMNRFRDHSYLPYNNLFSLMIKRLGRYDRADLERMAATLQRDDLVVTAADKELHAWLRGAVASLIEQVLVAKAEGCVPLYDGKQDPMVFMSRLGRWLCELTVPPFRGVGAEKVKLRWGPNAQGHTVLDIVPVDPAIEDIPDWTKPDPAEEISDPITIELPDDT